MKKRLTVDVAYCGLSGCPNVWVTVPAGDGGRPQTAHIQGSRRNVYHPLLCDKLNVEFCSRDCHRRAHTAEAHGEKWRRTRILKTSLHARSGAWR